MVLYNDMRSSMISNIWSSNYVVLNEKHCYKDKDVVHAMTTEVNEHV